MRILRYWLLRPPFSETLGQNSALAFLIPLHVAAALGGAIALPCINSSI